MKYRLLSLAACALFISGLARADDYPSKESFTRTGVFDRTGDITLENVNGDVEIHTWDKNEILVEGEKSAKTDEELKLIDLNIDLTEAHAVIKVRLPKRPGKLFSGGNIRAAVRFKITVPATVALQKISTVNSSVNIDGVLGAVHGETVNGTIHAIGLRGDAGFKTVNGRIEASFDAVAAQQKLSFETVNGQITVSLPKDAGFELRSSVVNGSIDCDFPLASGQKKRGRTLSGRVGDGRASLHAETVNGRIHLEQR